MYTIEEEKYKRIKDVANVVGNKIWKIRFKNLIGNDMDT